MEGITKTRQGGLVKEDQRFPQWVYYQGHDWCPVKLLKPVISKRPIELENCGSLYLEPLNTPNDKVWCTAQPVSIHAIDTYMKYTAMQGGLDLTNKRFTNHSVRKTTTFCKLQKASVSSDKIAAVAEHRNEQSLRSYSNADLEDHQGMSKILSSGNSTAVLEVIIPAIIQFKQIDLSHSHLQYHFSNCTVYFGFPTSLAETPRPSFNNQPYKKHRVIIDSDSD